MTVPAPGVLANDTDPDSTTLTAALVSGPTAGTVTLHADGSFTYTSSSALGGSDAFTYTASDGVSTSSPATVTITTTTPASKNACTGGGWATLTDGDGQPFVNQGRCVSWVNATAEPRQETATDSVSTPSQAATRSVSTASTRASERRSTIRLSPFSRIPCFAAGPAAP